MELYEDKDTFIEPNKYDELQTTQIFFSGHNKIKIRVNNKKLLQRHSSVYGPIIPFQWPPMKLDTLLKTIKAHSQDSCEKKLNDVLYCQ